VGVDERQTLHLTGGDRIIFSYEVSRAVQGRPFGKDGLT
jgi:hypothetical protein